jgi:acyl-CoA synthetase (AMP-forming)/AMP-acid ligase II
MDSAAPETVVEVLRIAAVEGPDDEAFVDGDVRITFGALDIAADSVARVYAEAGLRKGDVVALLLPSSIEYAVCYHAALRIGAVTSGVNPRLGAQERRHIFEHLRPTVTVVDLLESRAEETDDCAGGASPRAGRGREIQCPEIREAVSEAIVGRGSAPPALPRLAASDPVAVVWTGGSTGIPKGALFDHDSLRAVAAGTDVLSAPGDRRLSPLPFAHVGYMTRAWDEISKRIATIITPTPWTAGEAIRLMADESVTVGQGVPTQWALVLAHPDFDRADLSSLRVAGTGAARVPPQLVRSMRERLGCPVVVRYTSTETSLGTGTRPGDPDEVVAMTVGVPVPGVELELVGADRSAVAPGEVGTVRLRSAAQMLGYVGLGTEIDPGRTAPVKDRNGWITTGDLGRIGEDGNLRLVGRATEMLIRGGYNVYPSEVEAVLGSHPAVTQASVVGAPDDVLGEVVVAFVVVADGAESPTLEMLRAHCKISLADYKAPDRLRVVSELPTTPLGKVDTPALAALVSGEQEEKEREEKEGVMP